LQSVTNTQSQAKIIAVQLSSTDKHAEPYYDNFWTFVLISSF